MLKPRRTPRPLVRLPNQKSQVPEDVAARVRLCAGCRKKVDDRASSWVFIRMISRAVTTIYLCAECVPEDRSKCAVCAAKQTIGRIPICTDCLFEYEAVVREAS